MNRGYITLLTVLIVSALAVSITTTVLLIGVANTQVTIIYQEQAQARFLADACAEEALQEIKDSNPFSGTGSLSLGQGTCDYNVTNPGGQNRNIELDGDVGDINRKAEIDIDQVNPQINVASWQELGDY